MSDVEPWEQELGDAVAKAVDGALVTRFVVIAETIDGNDGDPQIEWMASAQMTPWSILGVVSYVKATYEGRISNQERD